MYGPISNSLGLDLLLAAIILSLLLVKRGMRDIYLPPLILIFALQIYILVISVGNLYFESDWLFRFARIFLHFWAAITVGCVIIANHGVRRLYWYIVISALIASLTIIASITSEPLNGLLITEFQSAEAFDSFIETRFSGIFRTFTISYPLSVVTIFAAYLYSVGAMRGGTLLVVIIIIFMASFLNARAGWIIGFGSLLAIAFFAQSIRRKLASKVLVGMLISTAALIALAVNIDIIKDTPFYLPTSIALEFLINYVKGEGLVANSMLDYYSKFFDWNKNANLLQIIFGSGAFGRGEALYLFTDNGYAFILSGIGIVGLVMLLALMVLIIMPRRISDMKNPIWVILAILTLGMAAYNLKEYILLSRNFLALLAFAYAAYQFQSVEKARLMEGLHKSSELGLRRKRS
jgi:hypothetical protein